MDIIQNDVVDNVYVVVCDGFKGGHVVLAIDVCGLSQCVDKLFMSAARLI